MVAKKRACRAIGAFFVLCVLLGAFCAQAEGSALTLGIASSSGGSDSSVSVALEDMGRLMMAEIPADFSLQDITLSADAGAQVYVVQTENVLSGPIVMFHDQNGKSYILAEHVDFSHSVQTPVSCIVADHALNLLWYGSLSLTQSTQTAAQMAAPQPTAAAQAAAQPAAVPQATAQPSAVPQAETRPQATPRPQRTAMVLGASIANTPAPTRNPSLSPRSAILELPRDVLTVEKTSDVGYARLVKSGVNVRVEPDGTAIGKFDKGEVVFVSGSQKGKQNAVWYSCTGQTNHISGFVRGDMLEFLDNASLSRYLFSILPKATISPEALFRAQSVTPTASAQQSEATAAPSGGEAATAVPSAPPSSAQALENGKGYVGWQVSSLRRQPSTAGERVQAVSGGTLLTVLSAHTDNMGTLWYRVRTDAGLEGYLLADSVVLTGGAVAQATQTPAATEVPRATAAPQAASPAQFGSAVVAKSSVNFRDKPGGDVLVRLSKGTRVTVLGASVSAEGQTWYPVRVDGQDGYLRADMLEQLVPAATAKPEPTPEAVPTAASPLTEPETPAQTASPTPAQTKNETADTIRSAVELARYEEFADETAGTLAYTVLDFDGDGQDELLLAGIEEADGVRSLVLNGCKLVDGAIASVAARGLAPVLPNDSTLRVYVARQSDGLVICVCQADTATGEAQNAAAFAWRGDASELEVATVLEDAVPVVSLLNASCDSEGKIAAEEKGYTAPMENQNKGASGDEVWTAIFQTLLRFAKDTAQAVG